MSPVRLLARPLLASNFIWSGVERLRRPVQAAESLRPGLERLERRIPQVRDAKIDATQLARVLGGVQVGAGVLFAAGKMPRLAAALLVGTAAVDAVVGRHGHNTAAERTKHASLAGGVLLASVDTAGSPSLAWRAQHLVHDARKQLERTNKDVSHAVRSTAHEARDAARDARKAASGVMGR